MLTIPDTMPTNQEEYDYLINAVYQNGQERYTAECADARAKAEADFNAGLADRREAIVTEMAAALEEGEELDVSNVEAALAAEKRQAIDNAVMDIEQPQSLADIERMYSCYKPQPVEDMPEPEPQFMPDSFCRLADGRIYSVADAAFVHDRAVQETFEVPGGTEADLKQLLEYQQKVFWPQITIAPCLLTTDELFANLRAERDRRIAETDYLLTTDYPLEETARAKVTAYRTALRNLPAQEGAPWDGGGELTPWPALG